ncbi:unnamed protein product [Onchocerca ochengi]|nr:unnamed protein product [Onchocerca ochengi]
MNDSESKDLSEMEQLYRHEIIPPPCRGAEILRIPRYNKGMAFNLFERQYLGIHGLLPAAFETEELQVYRIICQVRAETNDLLKYIILDNLQDQNEKLYYRVITEHIKELLPIVYTPTVGLACQKFGYIFRRPK